MHAWWFRVVVIVLLAAGSPSPEVMAAEAAEVALLAVTPQLPELTPPRALHERRRAQERPGPPVFLVALGGALAGGLPAIVTVALSDEPGVAIVLGPTLPWLVSPLAATLLLDAPYGWALLGSFTGAFAGGTVGLALGMGITSLIAPGSWAVLGGAVMGAFTGIVLGCSVGTTIAVNEDRRMRRASAVAVLPMHTPDTHTSGLALVARW